MSDITTTGNGLLSFIERASRDETFSIEKFEALLRMRRDEEQDQARKAFNRAMAEVEAEIGPIIRDRINPAVNRKYATLEAISAVLRPVYSKHGFAVRFGCDKPPKEGWMRITCTTSHAGGYSEQIYLDSPVDVQQGGRGRTPVQAVGSTITYLRRYLLQLAFNVVLADDEDDDDGEVMRRAAAAPIASAAATPRSSVRSDRREQINAEVPLRAAAAEAEKPARKVDPTVYEAADGDVDKYAEIYAKHDIAIELLDERIPRKWMDNLEMLLTDARSQDVVVAIGGHSTVGNAIANAPPAIKARVSELLANAYARFAEPDELPEIVGADKVLAG
jgi:hypothetical protein